MEGHTNLLHKHKTTSGVYLAMRGAMNANSHQVLTSDPVINYGCCSGIVELVETQTKVTGDI